MFTLFTSFWPRHGSGHRSPSPGWAQHLCSELERFIYIYIYNYIYIKKYVILGGPVPCTFYSYLIFPMYVFEKMLIYREKNGS